MKTRVIKCRRLPRNVAAMVLFGFILTSVGTLSPRMLRHEMIHVRQQKHLLYIPFLLWYVLEWALKLVRCRNWDQAYRAISFEREAYANEHDPAYRPTPLSFLRYL